MCAHISIKNFPILTSAFRFIQVVSQLERGEVALEQSISLYEKGAALKAHCAAKLKSAEEKVEMIRQQEGKAVGTTAVEGL